MLNLALISPALAFGVAELLSLEAGAGRRARPARRLARRDDGEHAHPPRPRRHRAVDHDDRRLQRRRGRHRAAVPRALAIDHFGATGFDEDVNMLGVVARVLLITVDPALARDVPALALAGAGRRARAAGEANRARAVHRRRRRRGRSPRTSACSTTSTTSRWPRSSSTSTAMTVSFSIARVARLDDRQSTAIAIELGIHNAALAIAIGASISTVLTIPAAVYSAFMFISAGLFARLMYRRNASRPRRWPLAKIVAMAENGSGTWTRLPLRRDPLRLARADRRGRPRRPTCRSSCWRRSPTTAPPTTSGSRSSAPSPTASGRTTRAPGSTRSAPRRCCAAPTSSSSASATSTASGTPPSRPATPPRSASR